jgi:hypothetical protein
MKSLFYLNKLVTYQLQFEGYTNDQLSGKLVEVPINVFFFKISYATIICSYDILKWINW